MLLNNLISLHNQRCDIVLQRLKLDFKEWNLTHFLWDHLIFLQSEGFNEESLLLEGLLTLLSHFKTVAALIRLLLVRNLSFHCLWDYFRKICAWFHFKTLALHLDTFESHSMVSKLCTLWASAHHLTDLHVDKFIAELIVTLMIIHGPHYCRR